MFDRTINNGNWVVYYKSPHTGNINKTGRMKRRYAFDRFKLHVDAIAIEKIKGIFKKMIIKFGYETEISEYKLSKLHK